MFKDFVEVLPIDTGERWLEGSSLDASADPFAGTTAPNGKPIWSPQQAADNLLRNNVDWTFGNYGALDDGVLTYGFWASLEEVQSSYYAERDANGNFMHADQQYIANGVFLPFNEAQQAMAIANMQLWDDLIAVTFQPASSASEADITFGFVQMSPAAGAHAFYPQAEAWDAFFGTEEAGRMGGDVWANYLYSGAIPANGNSFEDLSIGNYAWFAITHELGHSLGLAHGGEYNASTTPPPITYAKHAYFYQDSQQYTIMSYFGGSVTGQRAVVWDSANSYFAAAQTPQVHDILAAQQAYGADMTTRAGDTVYGFNSTADRGVFDFTTNVAPIVTIWDAGGNDTLDLSGFDGNNIIDINEGAFSSAGYKINAATKAYFGLVTDAQVQAFAAGNGLGPDGRPRDNIAIAYDAEIENAIGGSGNDQIKGNALSNLLVGNAGNDRLIGGDKTDVFVLGAGNDTVVGEIMSKVSTKAGNLSIDIITDFNKSGDDTIDLSGLDALQALTGDQAFTFIGTDANKAAGQLSYKVYDSINGAENALGYDIDGVNGVGSVSGPVTIVFGNVDGGAPDFAIVLLGTSGVTASDFVL